MNPPHLLLLFQAKFLLSPGWSLSIIPVVCTHPLSLHFLVFHSLTLKSDSSTFPPNALRLLLPTASFFIKLSDRLGPILPDLWRHLSLFLPLPSRLHDTMLP